MSRYSDILPVRPERVVDVAGGACIGAGTYLWYYHEMYRLGGEAKLLFLVLGPLVAVLALLDHDRRLFATVLSLLFLYVVYLDFPVYYQTGLPIRVRNPAWPPRMHAIVGSNLSVAGAVLLLVNGLVAVTREHVLGVGTDAA